MGDRIKHGMNINYKSCLVEDFLSHHFHYTPASLNFGNTDLP